MAKAKPNTETALNDIMLAAKSGLSMKQIMFKAKRKTGKEVSERTVRSHLTVLAENGFVILVTKHDTVDYFQAVAARPPDQVLTPAGIVPAASLPAFRPAFRPIKFGRPASNVPAPTAPEPAPKQVAGSRAALAFVESLQGTKDLPDTTL
jgi:hypothetical protein